MTDELPVPGQIFERDGKRREVVAVHNCNMYPSIEWRRPGNTWNSYGANILTWRKWSRKAVHVHVPKGGRKVRND
jgi:hypothetical protein